MAIDELLRDVLAAVGLLADGIGEGFVAIALGFAAMPTGIGFLVGAGLMLAFQSVTPVSFNVESLTVVSRRAKGDWRTMAYAVMIAGIAGAALGLIGVYGALVDFIGVPIQGGMMAGAGLILSIVAVELIRENWKIGGLSTVVAVVVFIVTKDLIWALIVSVAAGVVLGRWVPSTPVVANREIEKVRLVPRSWQDAKTFLRNPNVIRAALALLALRAGTSIAYPSITAGFAGVTPNFDHQNIIIGASGFASALFGGAPLEAIVSPTGAAPHPIGAGALFMALMGGICLLGLLPRMGRWVPVQSVCGILVVIGGLIVIPDNLPLLLDDPVPGSITMAVTAATTDPFIGMVVGILVRALLGAVGA